MRDQPVLINTVPGAMVLQEILERIEWVGGTGDPQSYAPHIRKDPLEGNCGPHPRWRRREWGPRSWWQRKDVIIHMMKTDRTVPNPAMSAFIRAGDLKDRTTCYRYDFVFPTFDPAEMAGLTGLTAAERTRAKNPHVLLSNLTNPPPDRAPKSAAIAFAHRDMALEQLAVFFASDGEVTIDPDGDGPFFETPIQGDLPEDTNFIP